MLSWMSEPLAAKKQLLSNHLLAQDCEIENFVFAKIVWVYVKEVVFSYLRAELNI